MANAVAEPVALPKHIALVCADMVTVGPVKLLTVAAENAWQPLLSVTVTLYVPATIPVRFCNVIELLQLYEDGATPPVALTPAVPLLIPQVASVLFVVAVNIGGSVIVTDVLD